MNWLRAQAKWWLLRYDPWRLSRKHGIRAWARREGADLHAYIDAGSPEKTAIVLATAEALAREYNITRVR